MLTKSDKANPSFFSIGTQLLFIIKSLSKKGSYTCTSISNPLHLFATSLPILPKPIIRTFFLYNSKMSGSSDLLSKLPCLTRLSDRERFFVK